MIDGEKFNPSPNENAVALLVLIDKLCSSLHINFPKIFAGNLSKNLICKDREILIN